MKKHGKKYKEAKKLVEKPLYEIGEAIVLMKKTSTVKFDAGFFLKSMAGL